MSDPIAAAEAAGKARDIANRFETAVFLIAYGIAEKDGLYEADPHRYPYSQAFRHGMNILAALCAECSDDAEELLPTFNESDFIRNSAASDVREWTAAPLGSIPLEASESASSSWHTSQFSSPSNVLPWPLVKSSIHDLTSTNVKVPDSSSAAVAWFDDRSRGRCGL